MNLSRDTRLILAITALAGLAGCNAEDGIDHGSGHGANTVSVDYSLTGYAWEGYATHVPYYTEQLAVDLHHLNQDADLYVESPDGSHGCESLHIGTHPERCIFDYPMAGDWYVEVFGWHHDPMDYTLSIGLWPPDRDASLWPVDHAVAAVMVASSVDSAARLDTRLDSTERFLPLLRAITEQAPALAAGETTSRIKAADGGDLGKLVLLVSDAGYRRSVRLKGVMEDPATGAAHVLMTESDNPLVVSRYRHAPVDGIVTIRRKNHSTTVRLGAATGTGADIQLLVEPGPVTAELSWTSIAGNTLSLERLAPAGLR